MNDYIYGGTIYNKGRPEPHLHYTVESKSEYIRDEKWKLIHEINFAKKGEDSAGKSADKETFELYNIEKDPGEYVDLADKNPQILEDLKGKLNKWGLWSQEYLPVYLSSKEIPTSLIEDAREHGYW